MTLETHQITRYNNFIKWADGQSFTGYTEKHHIVPKCMGGGNEKSNIITLSPKAHYVAHKILAKAYPANIKLIRAFGAMSRNKTKRKLSSRQFEESRLAASFARSGVHNHMWNIGIRHPMYGRTHTLETKTKMSKTNSGVNHPQYGSGGVSHHNTGLVRSDALREQISLKTRGIAKPKVTCPHCKKSGGKPVMARFHFDNCKAKE